MATKKTSVRKITQPKATAKKTPAPKKATPKLKPKPVVKQSKSSTVNKKQIIKKTVPVKKVVSKAVLGNKKTAAVNPVKIEVLDPNIYPIGKFVLPEKITDKEIKKYIDELHHLPKQLKKATKKIKHKEQLHASYREGGWGIDQIIHHLADSHTNAFIRFKLALTENNPTIKPYKQNLWAETPDIQLPIKTSIKLLKVIHQKMIALVKNMDANDLKRTYVNPETNITFVLQEALAMYAWHGKHHLGQIEVAIKKSKEEKSSKEDENDGDDD
ncbi:MAG: putative metal-dependent hydrolase [Chitinophagales bacterium]